MARGAYPFSHHNTSIFFPSKMFDWFWRASNPSHDIPKSDSMIQLENQIEMMDKVFMR